MHEYEQFAYIYDELMQDTDYKEITTHIEEIIKKFRKDQDTKLVLDLACGTGTITSEMSSRGYDMIGVDISENMLEVAKSKLVDGEENKILYLCQDMREFELYGTVDAIICMFDSLNYITYYNDVKKIFSLVNNYLNPGGLFIFDINTIHKLSTVLGNNTYTYSNDNITYIWENEYDMRKRICEFYLTFFVKEEGLYRKFEEYHREKGYTIEAIEEALNCANLQLLEKYDEYTFNPGTRKSERITFVASKKL
jgi:SAM-dependent methyltransferase